MTVKNYLQPEFCSTNYIDANLNPTATITVTSGTGLGSTTALWDYATDAVYTSSGSADATAFEITIDLQDYQYVDVIKLLNMNFKTFTISAYIDSLSMYIPLVIQNTYPHNSFHLHLNIYPPGSYLVNSDNEYYYLNGAPIVAETLQIKLIKINCTHTQVANSEKSIGEIFIGQRIFKNSTNSCNSFEESYPDDYRNVQTNSLGKAFVYRGPGSFAADLSFRGLSATEFRALKGIITNGGNYTFFPTGGHFGAYLSPTFDFADIYLVTSIEDYKNNPWGSSNSTDTLSILVRETVNVG